MLAQTLNNNCGNHLKSGELFEPSDHKFKVLVYWYSRTREYHRGVAQPGSALRSGRRGRGFKSRHPDIANQAKIGLNNSIWADFLFTSHSHPNGLEKVVSAKVSALFSIGCANRVSFGIRVFITSPLLLVDPELASLSCPPHCGLLSPVPLL